MKKTCLFFLTSILCVLFLSVGYAEEMPDDVYGRILFECVNVIGQVDYPKLKTKKEELEKYLDAMQKIDKEIYDNWSDKKKIAFWINCYNAIYLKLVVDYYPIKSVWWKSLNNPRNSIYQLSKKSRERQYSFFGKLLTAEDIKTKILMRFKDPRIYGALCSATKGSHRLLNRVYRGEILYMLLDDQWLHFFADTSKFYISRAKNIVNVSSLFRQYESVFIENYDKQEFSPDFDKYKRAFLHFLLRYIPERDAVFLRRGTFNIKYVECDKSLNEQNNTPLVAEEF